MGLNRYECACGVGDGGGENEGTAGIHALLEGEGCGYVRRRCFGHLPWRVADAGLDAMGARHKKLQAICSHLRDGTTWTRLKAVAVQPREHGGLGMMTHTTSEYLDLFRESPPNILDERPETTALFLEWLVPRQQQVSALVVADQNLRRLISKHALLAVESLSSTEDCVYRHIDRIMLQKGLYLFHRIKGKPYIAATVDFSDLMNRASSIILSTELDDATCKLIEAISALGKEGTVGSADALAGPWALS